MIVKQATTQTLLEQARELFTEYQRSLGIDLCFQGFEQEMASLPGKYAPPQGRLYLAFSEDQLAGCVALRPIGKEQCELKRLYVRPPFRGLGLGQLLLQTVIADARDIGYRQMLLDTLPAMAAAQQLYRSAGFCVTEPYCFNPVEGSQYMKLELCCHGCCHGDGSFDTKSD